MVGGKLCIDIEGVRQGLVKSGAFIMTSFDENQGGWRMNRQASSATMGR